MSRIRRFEVTGRLVLFVFVGFFVVVAAVNAIMITAAVTTFGGVETQNAYKAGLAFNSDIAAARAQDARHWQVEVKRIAPEGSDFIITVRDASGRPVAGLDLDASLIHPTDRRRDGSFAIVSAGAGVFRAQATASAGQWDLVIVLRGSGEQLFRSRSRVVLK